MVLCAHLDARFLNITIFHSPTSAHIFLSENKRFPRYAFAILSIAQIINIVMASAAESELAALFCNGKRNDSPNANPHLHGLVPTKSPIQTDNSTTAGDTNKTIVPRRAKMMDMHFWWLSCRTSQDQICYYWDVSSKNWADYHTKHHPDT